MPCFSKYWSKIACKLGTAQIENSRSEKLLGVNNGSKLNFDKNIKIIYGKTQGKINALKKAASFTNIEKMKLIMNTYCNSQFSYYPLAWMFHGRSRNNTINKLQRKVST